jgi:hypothetical protein
MLAFMMTVLVIALALGLYAFAIAMWRWSALRPDLQRLGFGLGAVLALPTLLFPAYFLHLRVMDAPWYFEWRSWSVTDFIPCFSALCCGCVAGAIQQRERVRGLPLQRVRWTWEGPAMGLMLLLLVLGAAFAKPWFEPGPRWNREERWANEACLQSSASTCGPCASATILRSLGDDVSERLLASESRTSRAGTLNWLLARALRRRGYSVTFLAPASWLDVRAPALVGVQLPSGVGHFIAVLGRDGDLVEVGEPLEGRRRLRVSELNGRYRWQGFAMEIRSRE